MFWIELFADSYSFLIFWFVLNDASVSIVAASIIAILYMCVYVRYIYYIIQVELLMIDSKVTIFNWF